MKDQANKENVHLELLLPLNLNQKPKPRPNTDRNIIYGDHPNDCKGSLNNKDMNCNHKDFLLEKKKNYAQQIRERNLNHYKKKKGSQNNISKILTQFDDNHNKSTLDKMNFESHLTDDRQNSRIDAFQFGSMQFEASHQFQNIKSLNQPQKGQRKEVVKNIENQYYGDSNKNYSKQQNNSAKQLVKPTSKINTKSKVSKVSKVSKLNISSMIFSHSYDTPYNNEERNQLEIVQKHNSTFKKQLASFRKDNSSLRRELEQSKKTIGSLEQKASYLLSDNELKIQIIRKLEDKPEQSQENNAIEQLKDRIKFEPDLSESQMKQLIQNYQIQHFEMKSQVKTLELKNYMFERRLLQQSQSSRKIMAREVNCWRQKYIKARNQILRIKQNRNNMVLEMSLSTEMP